MRSLTRPPTIQNRSSQNKFYDDLLKQKYTQQLGRRAGGGKGQQYLCQAKTLGMIPVDESVWNKLTREEKQEIEKSAMRSRNSITVRWQKNTDLW